MPATLSSRKIRVLHLESTDVCQARCAQCARETDASFDSSKQNHLTIDQLSALLDTQQIANLDKMFMCGVYGDPAAGRHTLEIYRWFRSINHDITLGMNTNGALRSSDWWRELATILHQPLDYVVFSIDGLEDTNHIYRRGVDWHTLERNVATYVAAGGIAHWDMLIYRHNEHQIEACRRRAHDMGFSWFRAKVSKRKLVDGLERPISWVINDCGRGKINCHALGDQSMYLDAQGRLWPCCWLASDRRTTDVDFDAVAQTWNTSAPNPVCQESCSTVQGQTHFDRQWRIEVALT